MNDNLLGIDPYLARWGLKTHLHNWWKILAAKILQVLYLMDKNQYEYFISTQKDGTVFMHPCLDLSLSLSFKPLYPGIISENYITQSLGQFFKKSIANAFFTIAYLARCHQRHIVGWRLQYLPTNRENCYESKITEMVYSFCFFVLFCFCFFFVLFYFVGRGLFLLNVWLKTTCSHFQ